MATSFEQVHAQQIVGTLTTVDRLIVHGHLQSFRFRGLGLARFLDRQGLHVVRDFGLYVRQASDRVIPTRRASPPAPAVIRLLGQKIQPWKAEVVSSHRHCPPQGDTDRERRRRPEARRLKHRIRRNWIKMHEKWSVLRVETVINRPRDFRIARFERDRKGRMHGRWMRMGKGIGNLRRYLQVGEATNRRYLDAFGAANPVRHTIADLDTLCTGRVVKGDRCPRLNPVAVSEHRIDCGPTSGSMTGSSSLSWGGPSEVIARFLRNSPSPKSGDHPIESRNPSAYM